MKNKPNSLTTTPSIYIKNNIFDGEIIKVSHIYYT